MIDLIIQLQKRVDQLEQTTQTLRKDALDDQNNSTSHDMIQRLDALEIALKDQFKAFESFVHAYSVPSPQPQMPSQPLPPPSLRPTRIEETKSTCTQTIDAVTAQHQNTENTSMRKPIETLDVATQTPLATSPSQPLPIPPPVKTHSHDRTPRGPSLLRQSSTFSEGSTAPSPSNRTPKSTSTTQQNTPKYAASTPTSATAIKNPTNAAKGEVASNDDAASLRQRKVAFASKNNAQKEHIQKQKLAVEAAKREVARAAARSAQKMKEEKEKGLGSIAWILHVMLILLGVGALFSGIFLVVAIRARDEFRRHQRVM